MRKFLPIIVTYVLFPLTLQAQMDIPSTGFNPRATISEEVGITSISISYSRPGVKGREGKIWGGIVPNGFGTYNFLTRSMTSPWRAGANKATLIEFEHDVKIEEHDLKAGTYALFMSIEKDKAILVFSNQTEAWGSFNYHESDDVLRVEVQPQILDKNVEWLKYEFIDHKKNGCTIALQWEKLSVPFRVTVDVDDIVLKRIRQEFKGIKGFISANRIQASMYYFQKNTHLKEALSWAERAVSGKPFGQTSFSAYQNLANGYEKLNRLTEADSIMDQGLLIASLNQHVGYGKRLIKQNRISRAIEAMLNAQHKFGDVYSVNNVLSFAYSAKGSYKKAQIYASKALRQAPNERSESKVKKNIKKLKQRKDINK